MERICPNNIESNVDEYRYTYRNTYTLLGMLTTYDEIKERVVKMNNRAKETTGDRLMYFMIIII